MSYLVRNKWDLLPIHLTDEEIANPISVIMQFFSEESDLPRMSKELNLMCHSAFSEKCLLRREEIVSLIGFREYFDRLLEAASLLIKNDRNNETLIDENDLLNPKYFCQKSKNNNDICEYLPRHLNQEEYINPYKVINRFFKLKTLFKWKEVLGELFSASIGDTIILECTEDPNIWHTCEYFYKFLEAIHLIYEREP
jgi:hypothetical protein